MSILREDAFDWDVLGHEFFHFTTARGAARVVDTSLGGAHDGGSAIGQDDGTGHLRTRDEGMRLAWSEGLATAMSLLIQRTPPVPFSFPAILNVGDAAYQDTEDAALVTNAETPNRNEGKKTVASKRHSGTTRAAAPRSVQPPFPFLVVANWIAKAAHH